MPSVCSGSRQLTNFVVKQEWFGLKGKKEKRTVVACAEWQLVGLQTFLVIHMSASLTVIHTTTQ